VGTTDAEGGFSVHTPPGRFRVSATLPFDWPTDDRVITPGPVFPGRTIEVTVTAGSFSEVTLHLPVPPFPQPEPVLGGIRGLVLIGPVRPVEVEGETNERPYAGALVTVQAIGELNDRRPFFWTGRSNEEGRFELRAPAGRYRVTASAPNAKSLLPAADTKEITVTPRQTTEVTLHLDSGIR
jgi:hypothetical protein